MRTMSPKRRREQAERAVLRADRRWCEIGPILSRASMDGSVTMTEARVLADASLSCTRSTQGLHERRKSSSSGDRLNPANLMGACNRCNHWVEDNPDLAHALGLVVRPGDPEWDELGPAVSKIVAWPTQPRVCP